MDVQQNTFTGGLLKDINPHLTPNNILTDCINGTLITYDGNEFTLQNDMGNGRVESCRLDTDFIPLGMKSYGGVIYIVSHNPFTGECQIGSFPSPERNIDTDEISDLHTILDESLLYNNKADGIKTNYAKLDFGDFEKGVLRPGDKFLIYIEGADDLGFKSTFDKFWKYATRPSDGMKALYSLHLARVAENGNISYIEPDFPIYSTKDPKFFYTPNEVFNSIELKSVKDDSLYCIYKDRQNGFLAIVVEIEQPIEFSVELGNIAANPDENKFNLEFDIYSTAESINNVYGSRVGCKIYNEGVTKPAEDNNLVLDTGLGLKELELLRKNQDTGEWNSVNYSKVDSGNDLEVNSDETTEDGKKAFLLDTTSDKFPINLKDLTGEESIFPALNTRLRATLTGLDKKEKYLLQINPYSRFMWHSNLNYSEIISYDLLSSLKSTSIWRYKTVPSSTLTSSEYNTFLNYDFITRGTINGRNKCTLMYLEFYDIAADASLIYPLSKVTSGSNIIKIPNFKKDQEVECYYDQSEEEVKLKEGPKYVTNLEIGKHIKPYTKTTIEGLEIEGLKYYYILLDYSFSDIYLQACKNYNTEVKLTEELQIQLFKDKANVPSPLLGYKILDALCAMDYESGPVCVKIKSKLADTYLYNNITTQTGVNVSEYNKLRYNNLYVVGIIGLDIYSRELVSTQNADYIKFFTDDGIDKIAGDNIQELLDSTANNIINRSFACTEYTVFNLLFTNQWFNNIYDSELVDATRNFNTLINTIDNYSAPRFEATQPSLYTGEEGDDVIKKVFDPVTEVNLNDPSKWMYDIKPDPFKKEATLTYDRTYNWGLQYFTDVNNFKCGIIDQIVKFEPDKVGYEKPIILVDRTETPTVVEEYPEAALDANWKFTKDEEKKLITFKFLPHTVNTTKYEYNNPKEFTTSAIIYQPVDLSSALSSKLLVIMPYAEDSDQYYCAKMVDIGSPDRENYTNIVSEEFKSNVNDNSLPTEIFTNFIRTSVMVETDPMLAITYYTAVYGSKAKRDVGAFGWYTPSGAVTSNYKSLWVQSNKNSTVGGGGKSTGGIMSITYKTANLIVSLPIAMMLGSDYKTWDDNTKDINPVTALNPSIKRGFESLTRTFLEKFRVQAVDKTAKLKKYIPENISNDGGDILYTIAFEIKYKYDNDLKFYNKSQEVKDTLDNILTSLKPKLDPYTPTNQVYFTTEGVQTYDTYESFNLKRLDNEATQSYTFTIKSILKELNPELNRLLDTLASVSNYYTMDTKKKNNKIYLEKDNGEDKIYLETGFSYENGVMKLDAPNTMGSIYIAANKNGKDTDDREVFSMARNPKKVMPVLALSDYKEAWTTIALSTDGVGRRVVGPPPTPERPAEVMAGYFDETSAVDKSYFTYDPDRPIQTKRDVAKWEYTCNVEHDLYNAGRT